MKNVQPDMNVAKQRRKLTHLAGTVEDPTAVRYLHGLVELFDADVAAGLPRPASEFLPMYHEEFDLR